MKKKNTCEDCCLCCSGSSSDDCCAFIVAGKKKAQTAEALMRSRYTAYATGKEAYLRETWHPATCPNSLRLDAGQRWIGLKVLATEAGGVDDSFGIVEFVARYKIDGRGFRLHEISHFQRIGALWFYVGGELS